ncbi:shufflon-specific DNA recombinase [Escherichia coli B7A]|nr:shufflon-specific DNA recombinase [Escherichia coli B7A]EDV63391.1 shufflon-specific DNA recombinase [Escherichia coli B7A]EMX02094.1 putative shufflon-specific DNA recombinase [Escherichia coli P0304777.1]KEL67803.1 putative shufflon-specific DNA recombinase [Escherichia coli 5-366-08_S1_C1]
MPDVECRIDIAVVLCSTLRASPDAFMKWHFRHFVTTTMARFRTGKPLVEFYQVSAFCGERVSSPGALPVNDPDYIMICPLNPGSTPL